MEAELSLVRFSVINFFAVLLSVRPFQPIITILIKLVEALTLSEPTPDIQIQKRLKWIYEYTHKNVEVSLPIIELAVFKNLDKGLNRELEIENKTFLLIELYKYLDEISKELSGMVIKIAKKYSIDLPMFNIGTQQITKISLEENAT
jgi:hypothetical protein